MISLKPVHYEIEGNQIKGFYDNNQKEILLNVEDALDYCSCNQISVGCSNLYAILDKLTVCIYNNHMLIYKNDMADGFCPDTFTEGFLKNSHIKNTANLERTMIKMIMVCFYFAYRIELYELDSMKSKGTYSVVKKMGITIRRYQQGTNLFVVVKNARKSVKFLCNYPGKKEYVIPSQCYKLPSNGEVKYFYPDNMRCLNDGGLLDFILSGVKEAIGDCIGNCENIKKALFQSGYNKNHSIELYGGWVFQYNSRRLQQRTWIVIDDYSVIDYTSRKNGRLDSYILALEQGVYYPCTHENVASWLKQETDEFAMFSKYHYYGKVENSFYAGTKCCLGEAKKFFEKSIAKNKFLEAYKRNG